MSVPFPSIASSVTICIPPVLRHAAEQVKAEEPPVHPAWQKVGQRGRFFTLQTSDISDIEELADWAQCWLSEPSEPLDKIRRQAFQNIVDRAGRHVHLHAIGKGHLLAAGWRSRRTVAKAYKQRSCP